MTDSEKLREAAKWFDTVDRLFAAVKINGTEETVFDRLGPSPRVIQEDLLALADRLDADPAVLTQARAALVAASEYMIHEISYSDTDDQITAAIKAIDAVDDRPQELKDLMAHLANETVLMRRDDLQNIHRALIDASCIVSKSSSDYPVILSALRLAERAL